MICSAITASKEWEVIFNQGENWRIGIYRPKYRTASEVPELEQHTCPEAFLLLEGQLTMLYRQADGSLDEKTLRPRELTVFTEPHAGFSPDLSGVAFVVENAVFETTYTEIHSGVVTRRVEVKG